MRVEEVIERVASIRERAGDDEIAHIAEDHLWYDVLCFIAYKKIDMATASTLAREALKTKEIDFSRWCG